MNVKITIDLQDVYDDMPYNNQKKFLLENLDDLDIDEVLDEFNIDDISEYLSKYGYTVVENNTN